MQGSTAAGEPLKSARWPSWQAYVPEFVTALREGYGFAEARADLFAGLTVSVVALPLSLALAIASGVAPGRGLFTAVVAGIIVSALGGTRFQIAGPTGAFVIVVAGIVQRFGYDGLAAATLLAGGLLILVGLARLGSVIRYVPLPVVTGFTTGIAVVIFASQVGDLLGLAAKHVPPDAVGRIVSDIAALGTLNFAAVAIAGATLAVVLLLQKYAPRVPAFLVAIVLTSIAAQALHLPIATLGSKFGGIPSQLPSPHLPVFSIAGLQALVPAAFTIFILGGIESLLSAVVADNMTGRRHRANCELVAQGLANIACAIMGGIPATGAIARTATNIRSGARTPVAGIVHAVAILAMMAIFAPWASYIPLAALAAVLAIVCWKMAELHVFTLILQGSVGDRAVLILTFLLTVFVDLSFAIGAGVVLAALFFARDMAGLAHARTAPEPAFDHEGAFAAAGRHASGRNVLPPGLEVFHLSGPLFFATAAQFEEVLSRSGGYPKVLILRMGDVPLVDATGASALRRAVDAINARGTRVVLCEISPSASALLRSLSPDLHVAATLEGALEMGRAFLKH